MCKIATTTVTEDNYALAETQVIFKEYCHKIAKATGSATGTGVFLHKKSGMDPLDRTVMRPNYDTLYSFAVVDLAQEATLVMPESDETGRYQTTWLISEEHYNPFCCSEPGQYVLTSENVGTQHVMLVVRTQVNVADDADVAAANRMQEGLQILQTGPGSYNPLERWNMSEILAMRAHYEKLTCEKNITSEVMFGAKGADYLSLERHNCGTAYGWGGFTKEQAAYPCLRPGDNSGKTSYTLTLKDVPVGAFWSLTVYDNQGYVSTQPGHIYNINSAFAATDADGSCTVQFGGKQHTQVQDCNGNSAASNYMHIMEGWNVTLRLYLPTGEYFDGTWAVPQLEESKGQD